MEEKNVINVEVKEETKGIKGFIQKQRDKKDAEIELLASMDRDKRHEYLKRRRKRKIKKALGVGAVVAAAVAAGRLSAGSKTYEIETNGESEDTNVLPGEVEANSDYDQIKLYENDDAEDFSVNEIADIPIPEE